MKKVVTSRNQIRTCCAELEEAVFEDWSELEKFWLGTIAAGAFELCFFTVSVAEDVLCVSATFGEGTIGALGDCGFGVSFVLTSVPPRTRLLSGQLFCGKARGL